MNKSITSTPHGPEPIPDNLTPPANPSANPDASTQPAKEDDKAKADFLRQEIQQPIVPQPFNPAWQPQEPIDPTVFPQP